MKDERRELAEAKLAAIISDEEIARVHGHADFGNMSPRDVVSDGVRKAVVGYHCGHTQFTILREHGLTTKPRGMSYDVNLTKKGRTYARALLYQVLFGDPAAQALRRQPSVEAIRAILDATVDVELAGPREDRAEVVADTLDEAARQIAQLYKGEGG